MKQLVYKPNRHGIGLDIGWRVTDRDGVTITIKWGNVKDASYLPGIVTEANATGRECALGEELTEPWGLGDRGRGK